MGKALLQLEKVRPEFVEVFLEDKQDYKAWTPCPGCGGTRTDETGSASVGFGWYGWLVVNIIHPHGYMGWGLGNHKRGRRKLSVRGL